MPFLLDGRAALAVRNKYVLAVRNYMPYASKPLYGAMRIRLTMEAKDGFAD